MLISNNTVLFFGIIRYMDRLRKIEAFTKIGELGSFTEAAKALKISRPTMTRVMEELETDLGYKLLFRNTRGVYLTAKGQEFLPKARDLLLRTEELFGGGQTQEPRGLMRINLATTYDTFSLDRILGEFQEAYPDVRLELIYSDRPVPLVQNRMDLCFQVGGVVNPAYVKRKLGESNSWMCASPDYLKNGRPEKIKDLLDFDLLHNIVIDEQLGEELLRIKGRQVYTWWFTRGGKREKLKVKPKLACNFSGTLKEACLNGKGIAYLPIATTLEEVREGKLEVVLGQYRGIPVEVYATYASRLHKTPVHEVLLSFVEDRIKPLLNAAQSYF